MATSVIPALIDALHAAATTALPSVKVYDGFGVTNDPGDFLMIGVEDADLETAASSATSEQSWAHATGTQRDEAGELTCVALSWNGDGNPKTARDGAFAITAAVENLLRADPDLGLTNLLWTGYGSTVELSQGQGDTGAEALVVFKVAFRARI